MDFPRLPIVKFDENGLFQTFYINHFGEHLRKHHSDINHPHKHNFYLCVLFTKGRGKHLIDFQSYSIEPGSVFFLQPEQVHDWSFEEEPEGWIFFHSENFYKLYSGDFDLRQWPFFQTKNANPKLNLFLKNQEKISFFLQEMYEEYQANTRFSFIKIASLSQLIYADLSRVYLQEDAYILPYSNRYAKHHGIFIKLLEDHFLSEKNARFYAYKMGISVKHLHRICVAETGKNTSQLIADRIILEAKRKLVAEQKSVQEIGYELGFESVSYFQLFFKKNAGETPNHFRLRNL